MNYEKLSPSFSQNSRLLKARIPNFLENNDKYKWNLGIVNK